MSLIRMGKNFVMMVWVREFNRYVLHFKFCLNVCTLKPFFKVKTRISIEKLSFNLIEFDLMSFAG